MPELFSSGCPRTKVDSVTSLVLFLLYILKYDLFCFKDCLKRLSLCILLCSAPLTLRNSDVANGNSSGGRNNVLSSTFSRPMPHSTSPSPACFSVDQGKRKSVFLLFYFKLFTVYTVEPENCRFVFFSTIAVSTTLP